MGKERNARAVSLGRRIIARALQWRIVRAYLSYQDHRGPMLADSITYRALFSVFALVLLGFSFAALWLGDNPEALRALAKALDTMIPGMSAIVNPLKISATVSFTTVGIASLVGLLSAAVSAIASLRTALRVLGDQLHDDKFFLWVLLRNLLLGVLFGGLLVVAAVLGVVDAQGIEQLANWFGVSERSPLIDVATRLSGILMVFTIDTLAIALIYRMLAGVHAPARVLWAGAALGGVGLTALQELSGLFVRGATANPLLATFASLISLLLWFNLSAQVILYACTYILVGASEYRNRDRDRAKYGAKTLAGYRLQRAQDVYFAAARELRKAREAEGQEHRELDEIAGERTPDPASRD